MWRIDIEGGSEAAEQLAAALNRSAVPASSGGDAVWQVAAGPQEGAASLTCACVQADRSEWCRGTGQGLAEFTLQFLEPAALRRIFRRKFGIRDEVETDVLVSEAIARMDKDRARRLARRFAGHLRENGGLHLEGFVRFRLPDYRTEMDRAAEAAWEERVLERQYQEFMSLLHSMLEWQEVRIPAVHVFHQGGHAFRLTDDNMRPLESKAESGNVGFTDESEEESYLVSRLLAASPRFLYIHTDEPESQLIRTLLGIFGDRAAICPAATGFPFD
jgi:hypothetical protein